MPHFFTRAAGLLVLLATAALSACSGSIAPTMPPSSMVPASQRPFGVNTVVVTTVDGPKKLSGVKTLLFLCTDKPYCLKRDRVLSRGTTNAKGQSALKASFTSSDLVCAEANWTGSTASHTFDKTVSKCSNNFPKAVTLNFSRI